MCSQRQFLFSPGIQWNACFALLESSMSWTQPNRSNHLFLVVVSNFKLRKTFWFNTKYVQDRQPFCLIKTTTIALVRFNSSCSSLQALDPCTLVLILCIKHIKWQHAKVMSTRITHHVYHRQIQTNTKRTLSSARLTTFLSSSGENDCRSARKDFSWIVSEVFWPVSENHFWRITWRLWFCNAA